MSTFQCFISVKGFEFHLSQVSLLRQTEQRLQIESPTFEHRIQCYNVPISACFMYRL